jgi:hypothetical protein
MNTGSFRTVAVRLASAVLALAAVVSTQVAAQDVEPAALQILRRMTDYLGSLQRFSVDTQNTIEEVLDTGQKIQFDLSTRVTVQRPNKVRAERAGDLIKQVVIYDGKTITVYNASSNYYAVAAAPDNIDDALHFARDTLDIVPPSGDLVYTNAYQLLTAAVTSGGVVGKSMIGGVRCDHLAFSGPVVDWQIWIPDSGNPLPRKYVITTKDDPAQPQYMVLMSNWNVAPKLSDTLFKFTPPRGAKQTEFIRLNAGDASTR